MTTPGTIQSSDRGDAGAVVGRLAPSPTGALHIGNARTFLIAWLSVRSRGGKVVLRVEDIDSPRVKPWTVAEIIEDLRWLGLDWDEGPDVGGPAAPYVQTERLDRYRTAWSDLMARELVYPCTCTRSDVLTAASAPHADHEGPTYPGTCAWQRAADVSAHASLSCWRFRVPLGTMRVDDLYRGFIVGDPAAIGGDFVVWRAADTPAYQLAVVLDDAAMGITEVIRGDDLVPSTPRQILLYRAFGLRPPRFGHVPLVVGPDGRRLAKRHGDTRLSTLRKSQVRPESLIGLLAWSCGWLARLEPIRPRDLLSTFRLDAIPPEPFILRDEHLRAIGYLP